MQWQESVNHGQERIVNRNRLKDCHYVAIIRQDFNYNKNVKRCSGESENAELKGISAGSIKKELNKNARKVYHKCRTYLMSLTIHQVNRGKFQ